MARSSRASIYLRVVKRQFDAAMSHTMVALEGMKDSMQAVSRTARRMLLIGGAAFAYIIKKASDFEETASMFEAVFKEQTKAAEEWAFSTAKALNRSSIAIKGWMASLQDTFVPLGFARDEALALSKQLTQLGIDLASFKNVAEPETLDLLTSAIVGNHEAVRRFGIILTEATVKQEMANMGYKKGGEMSEALAKVMARINIIMASSADAQGDAARTAGSFANQLRGLLAVTNDLIVAIGTSFLPVMTDLVAKTSKAVLPMIKWVSENRHAVVAVSKHVGKLVLLAAVLPPLIIAFTKLGFVMTAATTAAAGLTAAGALLTFNPLIVAAGVATIALSALLDKVQSLRKEMEEIHEIEEEGKRWEALANSALEYALARKKMREEREKDAPVEEEEIQRTEKRQKQIDKLIQKLTEEGDTFSMSRREIELYRLGISDLTEEELRLITGLQEEIRLKDDAKKMTEELDEINKEYAEDLKQIADEQENFRTAMIRMSHDIGVAKGWIPKHGVDVARVADQYKVTIAQAERFVKLQEELAKATKKERKERERIVGIQQSAMAVWTRIQTAALGGKRSATAGGAAAAAFPKPVAPSADPVRIAGESKTVLERILEFLETFRTDLEFAGVLR